MQLVHACCAGLDVHQAVVVACSRIEKDGKVAYEIRRFTPTSGGLLQLSDWLTEAGCQHVAMEATGSYWKPVWAVLEGSFTVTLGNPEQMKGPHGRKSDREDAKRISDLLACGLIRPSFVPAQPIQDLRDLTRTRTQLMHEISRHSQRIGKTLEAANIKLGSILSELLGRAILKALIAGERDPTRLAALRHGGVKASAEDFEAALSGRLRGHHAFLIQLHLGQIEGLETTVDQLEARLEDLTRPFCRQMEILDSIPGISKTTCWTILAEMGPDPMVFPTPGHLVSWCGLCPRQDESAGRRRSTKLRHGDPWLKSILVQAAWGATRTRNSALAARYRRLKARIGSQKAIIALAAWMLALAHTLLCRNQLFNEPVALAAHQGSREQLARKLVRRIESLGLKVTIQSVAA
jgi:transposase